MDYTPSPEAARIAEERATRWHNRVEYTRERLLRMLAREVEDRGWANLSPGLRGAEDAYYRTEQASE